MKKTVSLSTLAVLLATTGPLLAADTAALEQRLNEQEARLRELESRQGHSSAGKVKISGFINVGAQTSNLDEGVTYLDADEDVTYRGLTSAGLQIDGEVTDRLSGTIQILAEGSENFDANVEWAYISYALTPNLKLRGGRLVLPLFMHSQYLNVGYAYPWITPPAEAYESAAVRTMEGVDLLYRFTTGPAAHTLNVYHGTLDVETDFSGTSVTYAVRNSTGINLSSQIGNVGTWLAYSTSDITLALPDFSAFGGPDFSPYNLDDDASHFLSAGVQYDNGSLLIMAERTHLEIDTDSEWFPAIDAAYVLAGYRLGKWMPHLTWSMVDDSGFSDVSADPLATALYTSSARHQKSWTFGVRADVAPNLAVKAEVSRYYDIGKDEQVNPLTGASTAGFFSAKPDRDDPMVFRLAANMVF